MTRDDAVSLAQEMNQDPSHEWKADFQWESPGTYQVDAWHKPSRRRHIFHHRDEWLAIKNHQPARRRKVKA